MKCYNHEDHDAIGVCKSCQKGLCMSCATTVDGSLSCIGKCEEDVAMLNYMIERGRRTYRHLGSQWRPAVLINGLGGAIFLAYGIFGSSHSISWLLIGIGSVMMIGGLLSYIQSRKMADRQDSSANAGQ